MWLTKSRLKKWIGIAIVGTTLPTCTHGCKAKQAGSDADLRKAFSQKTFSINDVPPEQRERVRAIMEAQKARKK